MSSSSRAKIRKKICNKTSLLCRQIMITCAQLTGKDSCISASVGIFTRLPNPGEQEDAEMPPMGVNFAFDFDTDAKGVFFLRDGEWCVWMDDVYYIDRRRNTPLRNRFNRCTIFTKLPYADDPKWSYLRDLAAHTSESGWNVPQDHERHLLNFPQEILDNILRFALIAPSNLTISPIFHMTCGRAELPVFEYCITNGKTSPETRQTPTEDSLGQFNAWRKIYRAAIDATCLRACKRLYNDGIAFLYENQLSFHTHSGTKDHTFNEAGSSIEVLNTRLSYAKAANDVSFLEHMINKTEGEFYGRDFEFMRKMCSFGIHRSGRDLVRMGNWYLARYYVTRPHLRWRVLAHLDSFMWFIGMIGMENAARIKNLRFVSFEHFDGFTLFTRYLTFVKHFCTGLEKLTIEIGWQLHSFPSGFNDYHMRAVALAHLLRGEIRDMKSLRVLEVFDVLKSEEQPDLLPYMRSNEAKGEKCVPKYANQTIALIDKQGKQKKRAQRTGYANAAARAIAKAKAIAKEKEEKERWEAIKARLVRNHSILDSSEIDLLVAEYKECITEWPKEMDWNVCCALAREHWKRTVVGAW